MQFSSFYFILVIQIPEFANIFIFLSYFAKYLFILTELMF